MNERLKELARQAKPNPNLIWEDAELERFAELVRQDYLRELKELKPVAWLYRGHLHDLDPAQWSLFPETATPLYALEVTK